MKFLIILQVQVKYLDLARKGIGQSGGTLTDMPVMSCSGLPEESNGSRPRDDCNMTTSPIVGLQSVTLQTAL